MKIEISEAHCKSCKILKKRILIGKFDLYNKKYIDDNGLTWNGKMCGECHQKRVKEHMANLRKNRNEKISLPTE